MVWGGLDGHDYMGGGAYLRTEGAGMYVYRTSHRNCYEFIVGWGEPEIGWVAVRNDNASSIPPTSIALASSQGLVRLYWGIRDMQETVLAC